MMRKKADDLSCPSCGGRFRLGKPMQHHLRDAHGLAGMAAHLIANPRDKQAASTIKGKRAGGVKRAFRRGNFKPARTVFLVLDEGFDVIEPWEDGQ